jgi:Zn-finger nucleic acid-binding protein
MLAMLAIYLGATYALERRRKSSFIDEAEEVEDIALTASIASIAVVVGIIMLVVDAKLPVEGATGIARIYGVSSVAPCCMIRLACPYQPGGSPFKRRRSSVIMKCPIDNESLVMSERSGVEIDYCPKCRGVWLDRGELDKIIERASAPDTSSTRSVPRTQHDKHEYLQKPHRKKKESFLSELFDF